MDHETAILIAERYVHLRMGERALKALESARLNDARTWLWRANALHSLGRDEESAAAARLGLEFDPQSPYLHVAVAIAEMARKLYPEAEAAAREAVRLDPEYAQAHSVLALILSATRRPMGAAKTLRQARSLEPQDTAVRIFDVLLMLQRREILAADAEARAILADEPDNSAAHWIRGMSLWTSGRCRAAAKHFQEAATLDPGDTLCVRCARIANHWLLWPLRMTMPAARGIAVIAWSITLMIGLDSSEWRPFWYSVALLLYIVAGMISVYRPLR
ncbi:MAG TPA: tetratricopeptide repeat protein [Thermoanaerobaculia bacterium]|nr:tetratricopeptide repeat protein [Thermoanaerobaculia bacterium]